MRTEETVCFRCDSKLPEKKSHVSWKDRCRTGLKIAFIFFAVMTVASLFTDMLPSFIKCLSVTFILMLVKSSADHMG